MKIFLAKLIFYFIKKTYNYIYMLKFDYKEVNC